MNALPHVNYFLGVLPVLQLSALHLSVKAVEWFVNVFLCFKAWKELF